jgi:hypothetical protein
MYDTGWLRLCDHAFGSGPSVTRRNIGLRIMLDSHDEQDFENLINDMKHKKFRVPRSQTARSIVNRLLAKRGYAQVEQRDQIQELWNQAVGPLLAQQSRCGRLLRGTMEVFVANSMVLSELTFDKVNILARLQRNAAGKAIQNLKFKLGAVD